MAAAAQMKAKGDFTSLSQDSANIAAVRSAGMPADRVLGLGAKGEADTAARCAACELRQRESAVCCCSTCWLGVGCGM